MQRCGTTHRRDLNLLKYCMSIECGQFRARCTVLSYVVVRPEASRAICKTGCLPRQSCQGEIQSNLQNTLCAMLDVRIAGPRLGRLYDKVLYQPQYMREGGRGGGGS